VCERAATAAAESKRKAVQAKPRPPRPPLRLRQKPRPPKKKPRARTRMSPDPVSDDPSKENGEASDIIGLCVTMTQHIVLGHGMMRHGSASPRITHSSNPHSSNPW
jgi:hypothetical protein